MSDSMNRPEVKLLSAQLQSWSTGIATEIQFWSNWIQTKGGHWPEDFRERFDQNMPLRGSIAKAIRELGKSKVDVLDVGSGPITNIGRTMTGVEVNITAVDPLAIIYNELLAKHQMNPPTLTKFATAEDLTSFFEYESFDIVHCCNALDHSMDPLKGLREMVHVAKVGGVILLQHHENEAVMENYGGMHQHNFTAEDGRFVIWNREGEVDVGMALGSSVEVEATLSGETLSDLVKRSVFVVIRKVAPTSAQLSLDTYRHRVSSLLEATVNTLAQRTS